MKEETKTFFPFLLILLIMLLILFFPSISIEGATRGLLLWFEKLIPSLFPFIVLTNMICSLGIFFKASHFLSHLTQPLLKLSGTAFLVFILGLIGGYPIGAKLTKQLLETQKIDFVEAQKMLCFSNNCGPIFIIGTIGTILLKNPSLGYFLLFTHILSAFVMLVLSRFYIPSDTYAPKTKATSQTTLSLPEIFTTSIQNAMDTIVYVGGYIIFFSVIISLMRDSTLFKSLCTYLASLIHLPVAYIEALLLGSLEFSNGSALIISSSPFTLISLALLSSVISFGGFCVFFQCSALLTGTSLPLSTYLVSKFYQAVISFLLTFILYPLFFHPLILPPSFYLACFILLLLFLVIIFHFKWLSYKELSPKNRLFSKKISNREG